MNDKKAIEKLMQATEEEPYARKMGIRTVSLEPGHAVVEMDSREDDGGRGPNQISRERRG